MSPSNIYGAEVPGVCALERQLSLVVYYCTDMRWATYSGYVAIGCVSKQAAYKHRIAATHPKRINGGIKISCNNRM